MYCRNSHIKLSDIDFPKEFVACADRYCNNLSHRLALDVLYSDIATALRDSALEGRKSRRKGNKHRVIGWNKHVQDAYATARTSFMEWCLCNKPKTGVVYDQMCKDRRVFKSRLKWCQNHQDQVKMDALADKHARGNFKDFWQSTNKLNSRPGQPISVDGASDPKNIADIFRHQFQVNSPLGPGQSTRITEMPNEKVQLRFNAKNVAKVIKALSKGKSPGHDGLSIEHLQYGGPHISRVLSMLYNLCVSHSYLPSDLMKTVVVPVVKNKTGDLSDKSNYRPISLATIIAKVFDGLLNTQLDAYLTLHDNQFGFRPKLSTESAILSLKHTVTYYTDRKTPIYACFLDLSKAFDLVAYDILWEKLVSIKLPYGLLNIFKYWYGHQINTVKWAGAMSESCILTLV